MIKVITTVGTSLFTNYLRKEVQVFLQRKENSNIEQAYKAILKEQDGSVIESAKYAIEEYWLNNIKTFVDIEGDLICEEAIGLNSQCCAEIQTILAISDKYKDQNLEVYLLCTDTISSQLGANIISKIKIQNISFKEPIRIHGLQIKDAKLFEEEGFFNLVNEVKVIKGTDTNVILNISGGYKALIPPLTLLAQLENMTLCYIYEGSGELIETGNLPINFDWGVIEDFTSYLQNDNQRKNKASEEVIRSMRDLKLVKSESYDLTIVGRLIAEYSKQASPFTATIFGYFIEHKLYECYAKFYRNEKVEHSVRVEGMGSEDIDILITPKLNEFISMEIKPFNVVRSKEKVEKIEKAFIERVIAVKDNSQRGIPTEIWLMLYSYTNIKNNTIAINATERALIDNMVVALKEQINPNLIFKVKHFFIEENKLKQERHIYQTFMKNPIKIEIIKDIYNNPIQ